jgi:hypothetical protein
MILVLTLLIRLMMGYEHHSEGMGRKFLDSFNQQHIFCYNGSPRKKISSMKHTQNIKEVYEANKNSGSDAYFYINGGRKAVCD